MGGQTRLREGGVREIGQDVARPVVPLQAYNPDVITVMRLSHFKTVMCASHTLTQLARPFAIFRYLSRSMFRKMCNVLDGCRYRTQLRSVIGSRTLRHPRRCMTEM